jgi:signal transduction histidine kinase
MLWLSPISILPLLGIGFCLSALFSGRSVAETVLGVRGRVAYSLLGLFAFASNVALLTLLNPGLGFSPRVSFVFEQVVQAYFVVIWLRTHAFFLEQHHVSPLPEVGSLTFGTLGLVAALVLDLEAVHYVSLFGIWTVPAFHSPIVAFLFLVQVLLVWGWTVAVASRQAKDVYPRKTIVFLGSLGVSFWVLDLLSIGLGAARVGFNSVGHVFLLAALWRSMNHKLHATFKTTSHMNSLRANLMDKLSHELRTPLGVVKGYLELMQSQVLGTVSDAQEKAIQTSLENVRAEAELIDDLLLSAHFERGIAPQNEVLNLFVPLHESVGSIRKLFLERQIDLVVEIGGTANMIGDGQLLKKMFDKLLHNCLVFSPNQSRVEISAIVHEAEKSVELLIVDQGPGINPNLFGSEDGLFTQIRGVESASYGLGLGLSLASEIAKLHNGEITLENRKAADSNEIHGLTVRVVFPVLV